MEQLPKRRRSVVVTGASAGIGRALAFEFAARGYDIGITARRREVLDATADALRAAHPGGLLRVAVATVDVDRDDTVEASLHALFDELGGVDIVVVNAGVNDLTRVGRGQFAQERQIIQTNLIGAMATISACVSYWLPGQAGHIVGVSSLAALQAIGGQGAYCASKAALSIYLDAARLELKRKNIAVTTILPGFVQTDIVDGIGRFPFVIEAAQAAREIVDAVERRKTTAIVPAWPWKWLRPLFGHIPQRFLR